MVNGQATVAVMSEPASLPVAADEAALLAAARSGDETAFERLTEPYRRELQLHCYRMLGSLHDAEDLLQETLLRAWRRLDSFAGRASFRRWLYTIATNACLNTLERTPRVLLFPSGEAAGPPAAATIESLQPYPDALLPDTDPAARLDLRESVALAFLAAIQHLPPRQRAVLILRDAVGWSAKDTAALLELSVASVNSALQRARATLRDRLGDRHEWSGSASAEERELLRRYVEAHERTDADALAELLREDARLTMPPHAVWYASREAILVAVRQGFDPEFGHLRSVVTAANRQPAVAHYLRRPGESVHRPLALDVLRVEGGLIAEITSFVSPELFPAFALPR
jgi:RNA polymerase sigma-70 factor, ECF subfamily